VAFYCNALHTAAEKGFAEITRLLLTAGADPSARDHNGKTALQIAKRKGHSQVIEILEPVTPAKVTSARKQKKKP
jgi:ankyrin repeat protein